METNEKEPFENMDIAELDSLHQQLNKEFGYADGERKETLAAEIAKVTLAKSKKLHDNGLDHLNANTSGGIVASSDNHRPESISAEVLKEGGEQDKNKEVDTSRQEGGAGGKKK